MKNATEAPATRQPASHRPPKHTELRVRVGQELHSAVVAHLEDMREREPMRGYILADAVRELVICGLSFHFGVYERLQTHVQRKNQDAMMKNEPEHWEIGDLTAALAQDLDVNRR